MYCHQLKYIYVNAYDGTEENGNLSAIQNQRLFYALPEAISHAKVMAGDVIEIHEMKITIHSPSPDALARAKKKMAELKGFLKSEDMKYVNSGKLIFKV